MIQSIVNKTRIDHLCVRCGETVHKGSKAWYYRTFIGRSYYHYEKCPRFQESIGKYAFGPHAGCKWKA